MIYTFGRIDARADIPVLLQGMVSMLWITTVIVIILVASSEVAKEKSFTIHDLACDIYI